MNDRLHTGWFMVLVMAMWLYPYLSFAQTGNDEITVSAMISDHKSLRTQHTARASVEVANMALHNIFRETTERYDTINIDLDRYTRSFELIDMLYSAGVTAANFYNSFNDVKDRIGDLGKILTEYVDNYTLKGYVVSEDTLIVNRLEELIGRVSDHGEELLRTLGVIATYSTGKVHATTTMFLENMEHLNYILDSIAGDVDNCFYHIDRYIRLRMYYYKPVVLAPPRSQQEILQDAISRWKGNARRVGFGGS